MRNKIILGSCLDILPTLEPNSIDTIITDPPYHLVSINKRFRKTSQADDNRTGADARNGAHAYARLSSGFMGKDWDGGGIAFQPETWAEVLRVAKPGAMLLAFGGTRTWHRLACAIEDAGWEIRDTVMWIHGQGFPKSKNISKAIDKAAGAEREVIKNYKGTFDINKSRVTHGYRKNGVKPSSLTAPATDDAQTWDGWGTALKPAFEPILLAMKPLDGTYANNALAWGVAGLNIDGGRVGTEVETWPKSRTFRPSQIQPGGEGGQTKLTGAAPNGRWPANVIHDGSEEVLAGFPNVKGPWGKDGNGNLKGATSMFKTGGVNSQNELRSQESGSAARFFYCAKASKSERTHNGTVENKHPTVKPLALMRYLVKLTATPTGGTVLDPFAGSGSTGVACKLEDRNFIGIELETESAETAQRRIDATEPEPMQLDLI